MQVALFPGAAIPIVVRSAQYEIISTSSPASASSTCNNPAAHSLWRCGVHAIAFESRGACEAGHRLLCGRKQRQERKRRWRRCCLAGQPAQGSAYGRPPPSRCRALVANFFWFDILTDNAVPCQNDAMSTAAAIVSVRAAQPDPTRAWARASATLNAIALLINLVFNLIRHGKNLAVAFYDRGREPGDNLTGGFLATVNIPIISKCMRRGVMRGVALDTAPAPLRAAGPARPDTCLDLANTAEETGASRDAPFVPIARHGGSLIQFTAEVDRRKAPASRIETPRFGVPPEHLHPDCLRAEEQSCDRAPPQQASAAWSSPEAEPCPETCEQTETAPVLHWPVSPAREVAATASL